MDVSYIPSRASQSALLISSQALIACSSSSWDRAVILAINFSRPAQDIFQAMMQQGVIVRPVANYGMPDFLRVTVGSEDENHRFVEVMDRVMAADV